MRSKVWIGLCVLLACALGVGATLLVRDSPDLVEHLAFTHSLEERRALDQDIARHALEARFQFATNYDQLASDERVGQAFQVALNDAWPAFLRSAERSAIEAAFSHYVILQNQRQQLLETFKSRNALLKNSVSYFPGLAGALMSQARDVELLRSIADLRSNTLGLALRNDAISAEAQRELLNRVATLARVHGDEVDARAVELMLAHARVIAEQKLQADLALGQILTLPMEGARQQVSRRYQRAYARAEKQEQAFGYAVLLLAFALLGFLIYVGLRLRAAAIALQGSHERLELAVEARTAELRAEMSRRERIEIELRQAQKLEAVGQLAASGCWERICPEAFAPIALR